MKAEGKELLWDQTRNLFVRDVEGVDQRLAGMTCDMELF